MIQSDELHASNFFSSLAFDDKLLTKIEGNESNDQQSSAENKFNFPIISTNLQIQECSSDYSDNEIPNRHNLSNSKRKYFTKKEDQILTSTALKYKQGNWNEIAKCLPGRTPKQCRDRWANYLKPSLHFGSWSESEDQLLVSLVNKYGTHWTKMKSHFSDRSTNSIKNRWYWLIKNNIGVMPLEKSIISSTESSCSGSIPIKSNNNEINNDKNEKKSNSKNNIDGNNESYVNTNSNPVNSSYDEPQSNNIQSFYFLVKTGNKKKISSKKIIKHKNSFSNDTNIANIEKNNQFKNQQENDKDLEDSDLITFNADELDW